jgi:hypothetical protein
MEAINGIIGTACFIGIATSMADMIKPSEEFNRQIRLIFSLLFILGVLTQLINGKFDFSFSKTVAVQDIPQYSS